MAKGRKRADSEILNLRGSRHGKNRPAQTAPRALLELPRPPRWLPKRARKLWKELGELLVSRAVLAGEDLDLLATLCMELDIYHDAQERISEDGLVLKIEKEAKDGKVYLAGTQRHPAHAIAQLALKNVIRLAAEFGLTPAARVNLRVPAELPAEDDLKKELMKGFSS